MDKLSDKEISDLKDYLIGTHLSIDAGLEMLGINDCPTTDVIEDQLLDDDGIERCDNCGWWEASSAMEQMDCLTLCEECMDHIDENGYFS